MLKDKITNKIKEFRANKCSAKRSDITTDGEIKRLQEQLCNYRVEINELRETTVAYADLLESAQISIKKYKIISVVLGIVLAAIGIIKFL